eukprot:snap_masked-scaffold_70-processed-gene-0.37-mRNA-1 protein AED:1.00 eAED:1.00 QI:0/0/0/0/1/1/2/0/61
MKEEIDVKQTMNMQFKELFPVIATSRKYDYYLKGNLVKKTLFTDYQVLVHVLNPNLFKKKA